MKRCNLLLLALLLLSGCETLNDALVRRFHEDVGLSRRVRGQIKEGLETRESKPPVTGPRMPAPAFMDQGKNLLDEGRKETRSLAMIWTE